MTCRAAKFAHKPRYAIYAQYAIYGIYAIYATDDEGPNREALVRPNLGRTGASGPGHNQVYMLYTLKAQCSHMQPLVTTLSFSRSHMQSLVTTLSFSRSHMQPLVTTLSFSRSHMQPIVTTLGPLAPVITKCICYIR